MAESINKALEEFLYPIKKIMAMSLPELADWLVKEKEAFSPDTFKTDIDKEKKGK